MKIIKNPTIFFPRRSWNSVSAKKENVSTGLPRKRREIGEVYERAGIVSLHKNIRKSQRNLHDMEPDG